MYRILVACAFLCATPLVAQWTVSPYAGGSVPLIAPTSLEAVTVPLALDPAGRVVIAAAMDKVIWRIRAGGAERIAGTGVSGFGGDGGPATAALLDGPRDAQWDASGNIYFVDANNYRIRRINPQGIITTVAGTGELWVAGMDREGPATSRSFVSPRNLTVRSSGDLYFTDYVFDGVNDQYQVFRVDTAGNLKVIAGVIDPNCGRCTDGDSVPALSAHLKGITSSGRMAFDRAGNLYVADSFIYTEIRRISPDGMITRIAGNYEGPPSAAQTFEGQVALASHLSNVNSLMVDGSGNIYFVHDSDFDRGRLIQICADGLLHVLHESGWTLYSDAAGRLVYVFHGGNGITLFDFLTGSTLGFIPRSFDVIAAPADGTPAANVRVTGPLAINQDGEIHFTDGCLIRKFDRSGLLRTVAGSACQSLPFMFWAGLTFDSHDHLWVNNNFGAAYIVSPDGQFLPQPSVLLSGRVVNQIAVDANDRLYAEFPTIGLTRTEADGTFQRIGTGPYSIGSDFAGNVYAANSDGVYRVLDDGSLSKVFNGNTILCGAGRLSVDARGRVWQWMGFTDTGGTHCVGLRAGLDSDGGRPGGYLADSLVQSTKFQIQGGASALAPDGTLYVEDSGRILRLSPILQAPTPIISAGGIVHSASYTGGAIAPGELISIFGSNFGPAAGVVQTAQAVNNVLPAALGRTKVFFGTLEGKITAATPDQINVFVPYGVTTGGFADVVVLVDDAPSLPMRVPVAEQAFGLFTLDSSGSGQGAILNQNQTVNGLTNPAHRGDIISLFGTGEGRTSPALPDGALEISTPYSKPSVPVTVKINGIDSEVLYAGSAPTLPTGAFQINVRIPLSLPRAGLPPGDPTVISVTVGNSVTTRNVTVTVQ